MPVNVDEVVSSVSTEAEQSPGPGGGTQPSWKSAADARDLQARLARDRARTAAEGFDD